MNQFDFQPDQPADAATLPLASQSALLPASSDDVLRLLSMSNGIDPSKIWKSGASVQLLVPSPLHAPVFGFVDSKSSASAAGMLPPQVPVVRRPPNAYQLFCNDVRPALSDPVSVCGARFPCISLVGLALHLADPPRYFGRGRYRNHYFVTFFYFPHLTPFWLNSGVPVSNN